MPQPYFQLKRDIQDNDVYIHLHGTFDGASAFELLSAIADAGRNRRAFIIDTDGLHRAYPFGKAILNWNLPKNDLRTKLHFTGNHARKLLPEGCILAEGGTYPAHVCNGNCKNCTCRQVTSAETDKPKALCRAESDVGC